MNNKMVIIPVAFEIRRINRLLKYTVVFICKIKRKKIRLNLRPDPSTIQMRIIMKLW